MARLTDDPILIEVALLADKAGEQGYYTLEAGLRMLLLGVKLEPTTARCLVQAGMLIVGCIKGKDTR